MVNRRHSSLTRKLPPELLAEVNAQLIAGRTYAEITAHVKALGHDVSPAAVGRYGKGHLAELERVALVSNQMKAIVAAVGDDALALQEGAVQTALTKIVEYLTQIGPETMQGEEASKIFQALARLQSSSVQRERLKADLKKKLAASAEAVVKQVKAKGVSDETAEMIKTKILEIAA
jgi:hypothetical protein